jgi:hypothetical protein
MLWPEPQKGKRMASDHAGRVPRRQDTGQARRRAGRDLSPGREIMRRIGTSHAHRNGPAPRGYPSPASFRPRPLLHRVVLGGDADAIGLDGTQHPADLVGR